jgi:hypothetical protein
VGRVGAGVGCDSSGLVADVGRDTSVVGAGVGRDTGGVGCDTSGVGRDTGGTVVGRETLVSLVQENICFYFALTRRTTNHHCVSANYFAFFTPQRGCTVLCWHTMFLKDTVCHGDKPCVFLLLK